jgi:cell wall-associated NlpC family hydrolase
MPDVVGLRPGEAADEPGLFDPAPFSRRLTPAREDLAADYLRGRVEAPRYASGTARQVAADALPIRRTPEPSGMQETQALFGEVFTVYDEAEGWAWGQSAFDDYVGYVEAAGLSPEVRTPTHRVTALRTYRYPEPDLKRPPVGLLPMNAKLAIEGTSEDGKYLREAGGAWVFAGHTAPMRDRAADPVAVMEAYLGTPYFWGGRTSLGLDCSGLIQQGYELAGLAIPRDADMQEAWFASAGRAEMIFEEGGARLWEEGALQRGDIVYWPGHTGVMVDAERMLHANATAMATTCDPLRPVAERLEREEGTAVSSIVRPAA